MSSSPPPALIPESVEGAVLRCAAAVKAAEPTAVLAAFWDFDGTLFEGDCSEGFLSGAGRRIPGLAERGVAAGHARRFPASGGFAPCWEEYQAAMREQGQSAAYQYLVQVFAGAREARLRTLAEEEFTGRLRSWFLEGALDLWRRLGAAGVECYVISASADFFVKGAAAVLGAPQERLHGLGLITGADGILTEVWAEPQTTWEGKAERLRLILAERAAQTGRNCYPVAAFGNDIVADGPMLKAVAQFRLPAPAPVAALVNQPVPPECQDWLRPVRFPGLTESPLLSDD